MLFFEADKKNFTTAEEYFTKNLFKPNVSFKIADVICLTDQI